MGDTSIPFGKFEECNFPFQIQEGLLKELAEMVVEDPNLLEMGEDHYGATVNALGELACEINPVAAKLEETYGAEVAGLLVLGPEAHRYFHMELIPTLQWLRDKFSI